MRAIVSVMGNDKPGIIAGTSTLLAQNQVNILDITQTIVRGIFTMVMLVDIENSKKDLTDLSDSLKELGNTLGVEIRIQHEDIFNSMHRI